MRMVNRNNMQIIWTYEWSNERQDFYEWRMSQDNREGNELDVRKWEKVIDQEVKRVGLSKWRNEMERKNTLEWYKEKETPAYESWYDGSLGSDLLFRARAQCMDVNVRNYRWSESGSKMCQMCDMGEDETVEHVLLECEKYDRERMDMMRVVLTEMGCEMNALIERTGREWMVLLLGLCGDTTVHMIDAMKMSVKKMWNESSLVFLLVCDNVYVFFISFLSLQGQSFQSSEATPEEMGN